MIPAILAAGLFSFFYYLSYAIEKFYVLNNFGILFNKGALWIGCHYSPYNKRYCINIVPCITIWIALPDGNVPARSKM